VGCIPSKGHLIFPSMDANYMPFVRSYQFSPVQTNDDHFRRQVYISIIDEIIQELDT
jgi:hypothetical protein